MVLLPVIEGFLEGLSAKRRGHSVNGNVEEWADTFWIITTIIYRRRKS